MNSGRSIERTCAGAVFAFALWTLVCNGVVLAEGNLHQLLIAAAVSGVVMVVMTGIAGRLARGRRTVPHTSPGPDPSPPSEESKSSSSTSLSLVASAALVIGFAAGAPLELLWAASLIYLGLALFAIRSETSPTTSAALRGVPFVWCAALGFALLPLFAHRGSPDDGYYLNVAVHAVDHPQNPLLLWDTMIGVPELPLMFSVYKVHSFELLGAALAWLTKLPVIGIFHWVLPALVGGLAVLAQATLLRRFVPQRWALALAVVLALLLFEKEAPQSFGTFGMLRLQQGKTALLLVFLPLVLVYASRFAERPNRRTWWLLFAAQIAAVGATSTGLWAAPLVSGLGLLAGAGLQLRGKAHGLRTLLLGLIASAHAIALGLWFVGDAVRETERAGPSDGVQLVSRTAESIEGGAELVRATWGTVFGEGWFAAFALFAVLSGWSVCGRGTARRAALLTTLFAVGVLLNPFLARHVAENVTGTSTYWRVLWLLPVPALVGALLTAPRAGRVPSWVALPLGLGLLIAMTGFDGPMRGVRWKPLGYKASARSYPHAEALATHAPEGCYVLAARDVAPWVATFHHHPFPLAVRPNYMAIHSAFLDETDVKARVQLWRYATGYRQVRQAAMMAAAFRRYDIGGVSFALGEEDRGELRRILTQAGFKSVLADAHFETWTR